MRASSVFIVFLCCCCCCYSPLQVNGANIGENLADFAWNLIGAISYIRHGHDDAVDGDDQSDSSLLQDPRFFYSTLYRFIIRTPSLSLEKEKRKLWLISCIQFQIRTSLFCFILFLNNNSVCLFVTVV